MLRRAAALALACVLSPVRLARELRERPDLPAAGIVYAAFLAAYWVFFSLKPAGFPASAAPAPREALDAAYWLSVVVWQPPLEGAWIAFLVGLCAFFSRGSLPARLLAASAWWLVLLLLVVSYAQLKGLSKAAFAAGSVAAYAPFVLLLRGPHGPPWRPVAAFMLALNSIGLLLFLPMGVSAALGHSKAYFASQVGGGLWLLAAGTLGLRELTGLRLPRAAMALLLSMFFQVLLPLVLYLLGLVPKEILKALFYG